MATSTRTCAIKKCEIFSCAVCHCCQNNLCLDHLKEHKDQLNTELTPFVNQINTFVDSLEHFSPTSLPSFQTLEQWRVAAHGTVDRFYERMRQELFEQTKNVPFEKLRVARNKLEQLVRKQGATRESINALTDDIRSIEQDINNLQNIQINLRPLVIDENVIIQSNTSSGPHAAEVHPNEFDFQIFVQLPTGRNSFMAIKPSDTIMEVKRKIEAKEGLPAINQHLKFMGKELRDDYTIATYGIQKTIYSTVVFQWKEKIMNAFDFAIINDPHIKPEPYISRIRFLNCAIR